MRKKFLMAISLVLLLLLTSVPAFAATDVKLQVNDDLMPSPGIALINGNSMIPVDTYAAFSGADVEWVSENEFTIQENDTVMKLTVGNKEAILADQVVALTAEPIKNGDSVLIPLRSVANAFGFEVDWVNDQWMATLNRSETRDGMTVSEVLAKSTAAGQEFNTYSMDGQFNIDVKVTADGKVDETAPQNITAKITGQMQNEPFQIYLKQTMTPVGVETIEPMDVETYMTEEKMYINVPGQGWIVQDMPFTPEFWKQQQDIQSDPLKAAAQMKEMGILLNFGNDVTLNDQEYYVVNAALDMEKFQEGFQKMIQQLTQAVPQESGNPVNMQQQLLKLFETAKLDYSYSILINKETFISDIINFDARLEMMIDSPVPAPAEGEPNADQPKQVKIDMDYNGTFNITELGGPFTAPDISSAVEMQLPQQVNAE